MRAVDVDFSQNYSLAQNTYIVPANSPIRSVADIDKPGTRIGVAERDAGDLFLTRTLKNAEIKRNPGGDIDVGLKWMADGEVAAYAANRQRLSDVVARTPGIRLLPDNFYGVEQAIIVRKATRRCSMSSTNSSTRRAPPDSSPPRSNARASPASTSRRRRRGEHLHPTRL